MPNRWNNGNHEDARWVALKGAQMPTLLVQSQGAPLQFSALPYTDEDDGSHRIQRGFAAFERDGFESGVQNAGCGFGQLRPASAATISAQLERDSVFVWFALAARKRR